MTLRNVIVLAVLALLCVIGIVLIQDGDETDGEALPSVWPKFARGDVNRIVVTGQGSTREVRRRPENPDRWDVVVGTELVRADANAVDDLLAALSQQSVRDRIERSGITKEDVAGFGLAEPGVEIALTLTGEPIRLRYGKLTREGTKIYMDTGPDTDVWVVPKDAFDFSTSAIASADGLRDTRVFDSALFDVAKLEIVRGGVTQSLVVRDPDQVWHVEQPFRGYANPTKFEQLLSRIVNAKLEKWLETGAPDLVKYGLEKPVYEIRITPRAEGRKPEVLLVGSPTAEGGVFAREDGTRTIVSLPKSFLDAISTEPGAYRDLAFTRLGHGGVGVDVKLGNVGYKLEKAGSTWDVTIGPDRKPADGEKVGKLLDQLRGWQTVEFLDKQRPEDFGVTGDDWVVVEREGAGREQGPELTLLFGRRGPDEKSVYARRKEDGGVERVDAGPYDALARGAAQFFRSSLRPEIPLDAVDGLKRLKGGRDDEDISFEVTRDLDAEDRSWKSVGEGRTGKLDGKAIHDIVTTIGSLKGEWIPFAPEKDKEPLGFKNLFETLALEIHLGNVEGPDPDLVTLYVGKRRAEGGYYARFSDSGGWAFILSDDDVETLKRKVWTGD